MPNVLQTLEQDYHTIFIPREKDRKTFDEIQRFGAWQAVVLTCMGFLGGLASNSVNFWQIIFVPGVFTSLAGSGVDICSFSVLTLLFRVSEKVATPTSIVLMAINASVGRIHDF